MSVLMPQASPARHDPAPELYARQLEAIQRIGARLTRLSSVQDIGLALCTETRQVIDYDNCRVYVVAGDGRELHPVAFRSHHPAYEQETIEALGARVGKEGEGLTGWVAATGEPLIVPDASVDPRAVNVPGTDEAVESMLLVPLRYDDRVTGVIVLSALGADRFAAADLRLLQILADQTAVAVENARLMAGRDALVAELQALVEIGRSAGEATDEEALAKALVRKVCQAAGADSCVLSRWDEGTTLLRTLASVGTVQPLEGAYDTIDYPTTRAVLHQARPAVVQLDDPEADPTEIELMRRLDEQTLVMVPLRAGGRTTGLLELAASGGRREFSPQELDFFTTMANQVGAALENARLVETLRHVADVDQLTGVANHRHLQERLRQEIARSIRTRRPLSVLMVDLDGFKAVNDAHGHAEGDRLLNEMATALKSALRANDVVARYGGDEFVILMPDTAEEAARKLGQRMLGAVADHRHVLPGGDEISLGASAGLAIYPADGRSPAALLAAADAAMYAVKRAGGGGVRRPREKSDLERAG
jgi:diguanylate cyclase (GGDEF)-like protein